MGLFLAKENFVFSLIVTSLFCLSSSFKKEISTLSHIAKKYSYSSILNYKKFFGYPFYMYDLQDMTLVVCLGTSDIF